MGYISNNKRAQRIRKKLKQVNSERFRLTIFRSSRNISAQIVDDMNNKTLVSATSVKKDSDQLVTYLTSECESSDRSYMGPDWAQVISSLRDKEQEQYDSSQMRKSHQAFDSETLDYFSFWENRN